MKVTPGAVVKICPLTYCHPINPTDVEFTTYAAWFDDNVLILIISVLSNENFLKTHNDFGVMHKHIVIGLRLNIFCFVDISRIDRIVTG